MGRSKQKQKQKRRRKASEHEDDETTSADSSEDNIKPASLNSEDDDEEEGDGRGVPAKYAQLPSTTKDKLTSQLVRYILNKTSQKQSIRFGDIHKDVFPQKDRSISSYLRFLFRKASKHLEEVFAYQVVPIGDTSTTRDVYIVVNGVASSEHLKQINKNERCTYQFLMMVLGMLWCAPGYQLPEGDLWKHLARVDATIKPKEAHCQLGDVSQLLKTFESQMYLVVTSELDADYNRIKLYSYGPRARLEIGKEEIMKYVCWRVTGREPSEREIEEVNNSVN